MNLRCSFCQTPFTIGRIEKLDALQHLDANNLTHYDAHCPRCRRATPVLRQKLEMTMPNWREALKALEAELKANPQQEAPLPTPEAESAPEPEPKPAHHRTRAGKASQQAPVIEKPAKSKPAKEISFPKEEPVAEKPAKEAPSTKKPAAQKKATTGRTTKKSK